MQSYSPPLLKMIGGLGKGVIGDVIRVVFQEEFILPHLFQTLYFCSNFSTICWAYRCVIFARALTFSNCHPFNNQSGLSVAMAIDLRRRHLHSRKFLTLCVIGEVVT